MPLTDAQIARYSRQIVVPRMGGRAQERLLGSSLVIIGTRDDIESPLQYLVGAGVGEIDLCVPGDRDEDLKSLCDRMRHLNPDSTARYGRIAQSPDLVLALIGSDAVVEYTIDEAPRIAAAVVVRLDAPGKIALLPTPPPCIRCAPGGLLDRFGERAERADFIAMLAATEALKILAAYEPAVSASLLNFDGYQTTLQTLQPPPRPSCTCSNG